MKSKTDEQLMEIFQKNKDDLGQLAFDHLYHRYAKTMVNYFFYALNKDYQKAQDFLHDLFLKIMENGNSYNSQKSFKPWIYRIAVNMCHNEYRRQKVYRKYEEHAKNTESLTISNESNNTNEVWQFVNSLKPEQQSLIILRFKFNLSVKEMATVFNCAEGTIKSRLFYTTKELSKILKKHNYEF